MGRQGDDRDVELLCTIANGGLDALVPWRVAALFLNVRSRQALQKKVTAGELQRRAGMFRIQDIQSYVSGTQEDFERGVEKLRELTRRKIRTDTHKAMLLQDLRAAGVTLAEVYALGRILRRLKRQP